eukprot:483108-Amphidinium_carterae.3
MTSSVRHPNAAGHGACSPSFPSRSVLGLLVGFGHGGMMQGWPIECPSDGHHGSMFLTRELELACTFLEEVAGHKDLVSPDGGKRWQPNKHKEALLPLGVDVRSSSAWMDMANTTSEQQAHWLRCGACPKSTCAWLTAHRQEV